ncbi:hypothetical protein, partial [Klebsiella pneumoniae]|uniref:hypothetical protein n=1 Tax=Klebsiella pneumoniae TaxID=573 RepID=UPI00210D3700
RGAQLFVTRSKPIVSFSLRFVIIRRQSFTHFAMAVMLSHAFILMFITQKGTTMATPTFDTIEAQASYGIIICSRSAT